MLSRYDTNHAHQISLNKHLFISTNLKLHLRMMRGPLSYAGIRSRTEGLDKVNFDLIMGKTKSQGICKVLRIHVEVGMSICTKKSLGFMISAP